MDSSDTDEDIISSSALVIASALYQRRQVNVRIECLREIHGYVKKQLTNHRLATEQEIDGRRRIETVFS